MLVRLTSDGEPGSEVELLETGEVGELDGGV